MSSSSSTPGEDENAYLDAIWEATRRLARAPVTPRPFAMAEMYRPMAKWILESLNFMDSIDDLPSLEEEEDEWISKTDDEQFFRRVDYLRQLLRALAPLSWPVALNLCQLRHERVWIVMAQWLPIAEHLRPMVWELCKQPILLENVWDWQAAHRLWIFFQRRGLSHLWRQRMDWSKAFQNFPSQSIQWYAVRVAAYWLNLNRIAFLEYVQRKGVAQDYHECEIHLWERSKEAEHFQSNQFNGVVSIWKAPSVPLISAEGISLPPPLVQVAPGSYYYPRHGQAGKPLLLETPTTRSNLQRLSLSLSLQSPLLVSKASLVRHIAKLRNQPILELHIDADLDGPTLVGTHTMTAKGITWQAGSLTQAVTQGSWVMVHSIDQVPWSVQAVLEPLFQRQWSARSEDVPVHADFMLFATYRYDRGILNTQKWHKVPLESLPVEEWRMIGADLPDGIVDVVLQLYTELKLDIRRVLKLWKRLRGLEWGSSYLTEAQRRVCLSEAIDVLGHEVTDLATQYWQLAPNLPRTMPTITLEPQWVQIGRAQLPRISVNMGEEVSRFAQGPMMELLESVTVSLQHNEPVLLVGETGCGKTTLIGHLAALCGQKLIVQNLSLQTDATDLVGGYKPVSIEHVGQEMYKDFIDLFTGTFSRSKNAQFLLHVQQNVQRKQWERAAQCFIRGAQLGISKKKDAWCSFQERARSFQEHTQSTTVFEFATGALVRAITEGHWILLDEVNLASSETLQRLVGCLQEGTLVLTERGDTVPLLRHPDFRLLAAMNPATDAGKKDLPESLRSRFTSLYVKELVDPLQLRLVASRYIPETTEQVLYGVVELYLECRKLAEQSLVDSSGHRPRYTLRTLARALTAASNLMKEQHFKLMRALNEGFTLAFSSSNRSLRKLVQSRFPQSNEDHPGRRPGGRSTNPSDYVLVESFWLPHGKQVPVVDWSVPQSDGISKYVLIPSTRANLRRLVRAVASGPWPILLEGPTSAGKTSLVEYLANRCGQKVVRINNHEHTDIQEYTGGFAADSDGKLTFQEGLLVEALRKGFWVILDELNLAPTEVLEALNRLLDDNRELFLPETNEVVKPHPLFRLFATQNPTGAYGGRKPLSRAFRNRFMELPVGDIPSHEMVTVLEEACGCPPSHAKAVVAVMDGLRVQRRQSDMFLGKDGLVTPRDLLRWASRSNGSKLELAQEGYMVLAERLRNEVEQKDVQEEIEKHLKVKLNIEDLYYGPHARQQLDIFLENSHGDNDLIKGVAPTRSILRLLTLVLRCIKQREPVLLVGGE